MTNGWLLFPPGSYEIPEMCLYMMAIDDRIIEDTERASVMIDRESLMPNDMAGGQSQVTIRIYDNDGK